MGDEPGATVDALDLLPVGPLPEETLDELTARLSRHVELPCRALAPPPTLVLPRLSGRGQVDAGVLLAALESLPRRTGHLLVGLTPEDLAMPVFTFVFGLARTGGEATIVSLARLDPAFYGLDPDPALRDRRVVSEIRHELGHLSGRGHCPDRSCLMSFAGTIEKVDTRGERFCSDCARELPAWLSGPRSFIDPPPHPSPRRGKGLL
jgi:archaemetzincin